MQQADSARPVILVMGRSGSGKTSITNIVFHQLSPLDTTFLENTISLEVSRVATNPLTRFDIWEVPGDWCAGEDVVCADGTLLSSEAIFARASMLLFVIDAQDEDVTTVHSWQVRHLVAAMSQAHAVSPEMSFVVLIHKMDDDPFVSGGARFETQADLQYQIVQELEATGIDTIEPVYHMTSIYDHSIFMAFSRVVQNLIVELDHLEDILDRLLDACSFEKVFLFDTVSKLFIATDSKPVDPHRYELCSDMIDVVFHVSCIYGEKTAGESEVGGAGSISSSSSSSSSADGASSAAPPVLPPAGALAGALGGGTSSSEAKRSGAPSNASGMAFDDGSTSVMHLSGGYYEGTVLYLRQVSSCLALVCWLREESFLKKGLIDYNINCFKSTLREMCVLASKE